MRAAGMMSLAAAMISALRTSKTSGASARPSRENRSVAEMKKGVPMTDLLGGVACGPWARA
jgi:hypothetical protein